MGCTISKVTPQQNEHECCPLCTNKNKSKDLNPYVDYHIRMDALNFRDKGGICPKLISNKV